MIKLAQVATFGPVTHWCREAKWNGLHGSLLSLVLGVLAFFMSPVLGVVICVGAALALSLTWRRPMFRTWRGEVKVIEGTLFLDRWATLKNPERVDIEVVGAIHHVRIFDGGTYPRLSVTTYSAEEAQRLRDALIEPEPMPEPQPDPSERLRVGLQRLNESGYRGASLERAHLQELLDDPEADEAARDAAAMLLGDEPERR